MLDFNYKMLTLAREARGLTQTQLSKETQTDQGNLSKIEQGLQKPSKDAFEKYCKALNFPEHFFYQQESKTSISDFFYRKRMSLGAKEKLKLEAQIDILRLLYNKLLKSVEIPTPKFPSLGQNKNFLIPDIAILAREFYSVPRGPIKDLISLLERNGIAVINLDVAFDKFDGMTVYTDDNYPMIFLNKNMSNDRKRFTLAHELGHQIMHLPFRFEHSIYDRLEKDANVLEKEADMFASEFLMPEKDCKNELFNLTYKKLSDLKLYWKVSKKAIIQKAKTIGMLNDRQYQNLLIDLGKRGERVIESFDVELDEPKIFQQIFKAYSVDLGYSNQDLASYLCISETDLVRVKNTMSNSKLKIAI
ncbi:MAG: ImmA/IrrE family metallo-endopeptidase [Williamsia sp.]|nr:ImmA/IrrE family metallo-endopeptidase [Williamsia sp.]